MATEIVRISAPEGARPLDVIFVHGLNGDPVKTWQRGGGKEKAESWLNWIAEDFPRVGVWSLGYEAWATKWQGPAMPLQDRGGNALALLRAAGLGTNPICFVAHSMGGLVVKQLLFHAHVLAPEFRSEARAVRGVVFLATPHTGSGLATLADAFKRSLRGTTALEDLRNNSPYLRMLTTWYRSNASALSLQNLVLFENQTTAGVLVVDEVSSDPAIPGVVPIRIDASHSSICKPSSRASLVYGLTRRFVDDLVSAGCEDVLTAEAPEYVELSRSDSAGSVPHSESFAQPAYIEFENLTQNILQLYWHDYDGREVLLGAVDPHTVKRLNTFVSHPWTVTRADGTPLGTFFPVADAIGRVKIHAKDMG